MHHVGLFEVCGDDCPHCLALQSALNGLLEARKLSRGSRTSLLSVTTAGDDSSTDSSSSGSDLASSEACCPRIPPNDDVAAAVEAFRAPASMSSAVPSVVPHAALRAAWDAAEEDGLLRYGLAGDMAAQQRHLGGKFGLVAQFVPGRASKRPPAVRTVGHVDVPFRADAFHFGKIAPTEILGYLVPKEAGPRWSTQAEAGAARVLLNVSPVCHGHFLLTGQEASKPQVLGEELLTLALQFQRADAGGEWHLAFNSMGGGASVNNEHWQGFTVPMPVLARARSSRKHADVTLAVVPDWPLPVAGVGGPLASVVREVLAIVAALRSRNIAYNVLVAEGHAWVFPRALCNPYGTGGDVSRLQVAAHEASGVLIVPTREDFDGLSAESAEALLRSARADPADVAQALRDAGWPEDLW